MKKKSLIILMLVVLTLTGCQNDSTGFIKDSGKLNVYVSFYPMEFIVDRLGGDKVNLKTIVKEGMEPHDFEPSLADMKNLDKTDIFVYNGLGLESWADDLVKAVDNEELRTIRASDFVDPIDNKDGEDPHIWLDPNNMIEIARGVVDVLVEKDGDNEEYYRENYDQLEKELIELDQSYRNRLENKKKKDILVSHKAFSYMARRYEFEQIAVAGISPEEEPSPKNIASLIDQAREKELDYIFLETLSNSKAVDLISKEAGLEVLSLNPLEGLTQEDLDQEKDYISIMYDNLDNLEKALVK